MLLPMQQFYITKMMMLIFSIIVMCSYLNLVCLVCRVLKNTYFKEHVSVVASKYSICDTEKMLRNLSYVQCLNIAPLEKAWFMAPMEYSPNGKGIMVPTEFSPMV